MIMTDAEMDALFEASKLDTTILIGSDVRQLIGEIRRLREAATACLTASKVGVSEAEGMRRLDRLARLVGYDAGPVPSTGLPAPRSNDFEAMGREMNRLMDVIAYEGERYSPGWAFALFAFEDKPDPQNGHVLQGSRDRDRSLAAVAKWVMERIDAKKPKASS